MVMGRRLGRINPDTAQSAVNWARQRRCSCEIDKNFLNLIGKQLLQVLVLPHQLDEHLVPCLDLLEVSCVVKEATLGGDHLELEDLVQVRAS